MPVHSGGDGAPVLYFVDYILQARGESSADGGVSRRSSGIFNQS